MLLSGTFCRSAVNLAAVVGDLEATHEASNRVAMAPLAAGTEAEVEVAHV